MGEVSVLTHSPTIFTDIVLPQIPIVDSELRKAAGGEEEGGECTSPGTSGSKLVTAHGTYATQSAFTAAAAVKEEKMYVSVEIIFPLTGWVSIQPTIKKLSVGWQVFYSCCIGFYSD